MRDDAPTELRSTPAPPRFAEARFTPGAVVAGRYRIVSLLGGGGMGEVYRARICTPVSVSRRGAGRV